MRKPRNRAPAEVECLGGGNFIQAAEPLRRPGSERAAKRVPKASLSEGGFVKGNFTLIFFLQKFESSFPKGGSSLSQILL